MRVLLSALACEPGKGSEPEVGYRAALAAAQRHDVWVLTDDASVGPLQAALADEPDGARIRVHGIPFADAEFGRSTAGVLAFQWHYNRWQRKVARVSAELDAEIDFDVVHHVTLASYWTRAGVAAVDKPLVWGPIGGGVEPPMRLLSQLGPAGLAEHALRFAGRHLLARLAFARQPAEQAVVVFAQNPATAKRLRARGDVRLLSNATSVGMTDLPARRAPEPRLMFVGRLVGWKGPLLALRALRHLNDSSATLHFYGSGPERARLERRVERWGLTERVAFWGWMPRHVVLEQLASAAALVHPALHEEAGLCIAEALIIGVPVVCLAHGGPPEVTRQWPQRTARLIRPQTTDATARDIAAALDDVLAASPSALPAPMPPETSFAQQLLTAYSDAATGRPGQTRRARRR
ncbi:MAG: glycosyltransferase [Actinomycetota bacterium]|nr:glycosyltransferase [Actinomycetota bacterium]